MKRFVRSLIAMALAVAIILPMLPAGAQEGALPVLILPSNNAHFLPGTYFDFRVEVHAAELPADFAVTVNGTPAAEFFGAEPTSESWEFGGNADQGVAGTPSQSVIWRGVIAPAAGEYMVEVTAGGNTTSATWTVREPQAGDAKNVILFIADGGSVAVYTAARLLSRGMEAGVYNDRLSFEKFEEIGLLSTSGLDSIITDSANSASAYNTGHKSAVNATGVYPDTSPDLLDDPRVETFAEAAARTRGMAVGIVTTSDWTDATPAAVFAHGRNRSSGNRAAYAAQAFDSGLLPQVIFGGGARFMLPQTAEGSSRGDDRDLFAEYEAAGYTVVSTATELAEVTAAAPERVLGLFHISDMNVWLDRNVYTDNVASFPDQPGLVEMTVAALEILNQNPNGFYLEVEAASIDKQLHPMDWDRALADTIEFDRAIAAAYEWTQANAPDTLIVVTADHAHSYDVYGTVDVEAFNAATDDLGRRDAIGIYQAAGFPTYEDADGDFYPDNWSPSVVLAQGKVDFPPFTEDFQVSPVPRTPAINNEEGVTVDNPEDDPNGITMNSNLPNGSNSSVHTFQDVTVYATGPGAEFFGRSLENVEVFFGMAAAIGLDPSAEGGMVAAAVTPNAETTTQKTETAGASFPMNAVSAIALVIIGLVGGMYISRRKTTVQN